MSSKLLLPRCGVFRPQFQLAEVLPTKHVHMRMRQVSADWVIEDEPEKRLEQSKAFCNAGIHKQTGNINKGDFEVTFQAECRRARVCEEEYREAVRSGHVLLFVSSTKQRNPNS